MNRQKELAKNTAILTVGKICTQFVNFFLLPLYTAVLSTTEYGTYDLLISYSAILLPLVNLQLDQGLFRYILDCRNDTKKQSEVFSTLVFFSTLQGIVFLVLYKIVSSFFYIEYGFFLAIYVMLSLYVGILMQLLRGLGKNASFAIASFISVTTTTVMNVLALVVFRLGVKGLFVATIVSQVVTILFLVISTKCYKYFSISNIKYNIFISVLKYSFPLIPNDLAWWVVNASDRVIVSKILGVAMNGIYAAANKFSTMFINFYNVLNLSWTESVSVHFQDEDRDTYLSETITYLFNFFSSLGYILISLMPFLYPLLINEAYRDGYNHVYILIVAMLFRVLVGLYSTIYIAQKNTKEVAITSVLAAVINIVFNIALISKLNLYAASISTLAAFAFMFLFRYYDVNINRKMKVAIKKSIILRNVGMISILAVTYYDHNMILNIVAIIISILYGIFSNLDIIKSIRQAVIKKVIAT
ncbi:Membrane protein involved in the export of O-antigen and teichoic acid [Butyrivibrio sp. Su6]|uniref:lipopolysaccharide biosynthesis protein n=1 Tax=Butyrivibrio sp. Su6 TaxID=1520810 RepID=UPI00089EB536|nr:oligosaccharide flippase family protein [Butyrivibrio sp. Su6]SEG19743.1 Membrane protein involved in the export of O-antigen and teichoic acid [Butyrivibrio sp. Su6]